MFGQILEYKLLRRISPRGARGGCRPSAAYRGRSKLQTLFGKKIWAEVADKTVIDFGCGDGTAAIEMAQRGAKRVTGIDIQENLLIAARWNAERAGVSDRCKFSRWPHGKADVVLSVDAFEHYQDPAAVLHQMRRLVSPGGQLWISFGPPWLHPRGGHLFSVFPWAHLLFSEAALIRWRSDFTSDGAKAFSEVAGGLNRMTIRRFERLIAATDFHVAEFTTVPIRIARALHSRLTRELLTSVVRCRLTAPLDGAHRAEDGPPLRATVEVLAAQQSDTGNDFNRRA